MDNLVFIKLGGSLITDKDSPETARPDLIRALLGLIRSELARDPRLHILLGHGSGSFGHFAANQYHTREGVRTRLDWLGYQAVWHSARRLNQVVVEQAALAGLPVISFPPSATVVTANHAITEWPLTGLRLALQHGLVPLVYGDVVPDTAIGGTILSTEDLFSHLAGELRPNLILLAGVEEGVYQDYPDNKLLLTHISTDDADPASLGGSKSVDVTGGMLSKVRLMQALVRQQPGLQVRIFSALNPENLRAAIRGEAPGTLITW